jgi:hypothetical protein
MAQLAGRAWGHRLRPQVSSCTPEDDAAMSVYLQNLSKNPVVGDTARSENPRPTMPLLQRPYHRRGGRTTKRFDTSVSMLRSGRSTCTASIAGFSAEGAW